jgi:hypothetical protein
MTGALLHVRERDNFEATPKIWALLVRGHDVERLVRVAREHALQAPKLELYCLPAGYLVILPTPMERTSYGPDVQALQRRGHGLFFPIDAELWPPIQEAECDEFTLGDVLLLHPSWGCYRLNERDSISFASLFELPEIDSKTDWNVANPGPSLPPLLSAIRIELPPPEELFGEGDKGGIGDRPPPKRVVNEMNRAMRRASKSEGAPKQSSKKGPLSSLLARMYLKLYRRLPSGASRITFWDRLAAWAGQQFRSSSKIAGSVYFDWFMKELQEDPDSALRHAIPLSQEGGEGKGPDTEFMDLPNRDPTFLMSDLASGEGATSALYVSYADHRALVQRYRELAQRELERGRPRRAAYILGSLLGDLDGAAGMLLDGGYHREAAAIYEKLGAPDRAAHALALGGYLEDAIAIYEREQLYEMAGELCAKLGRHEEERRAFRQAANKYELEEAFERSAEIHERRLADPERALEVLRSGYRHDSSSLSERSAMLQKWLQIARRNDRRDQALKWLRGWPESEWRCELHAAAAIAFATAARRNDDPELCQLAADRVRSTVAAVLASPLGAAERNQALDALSSLGDDDRTLRRDVEELRTNRKGHAQGHTRQSRKRNSSVISSCTIQNSSLIAQARGHDELLLLVQDTSSESYEDRCTRLLSFYEGKLREEARWQGGESLPNACRVFLVAEGRPNGAVAMFSGDPRAELAARRRRRNGVRVSLPRLRGSYVITVARDWPPCQIKGYYDWNSGLPELFARVEDIHLGGQTSAKAISLPADTPLVVDADVQCCHVGGHTYISAPDGVYRINEKGTIEQRVWDEVPFAMIALGASEKPCLIASFEDGLRQHFSRRKSGDGHLLPFGDELREAHLAALTEELLIAVDRDVAHLYRIEADSITLIRQAQLDITEPILAVEGGFGIDDFVLLLGDLAHGDAATDRIHIRHCSWT